MTETTVGAEMRCMMTTYKIIRFRFGGENEVLKTGLTLEEAQEHCNSPETSSRTASPETLAEHPGVWFDGYTEE